MPDVWLRQHDASIRNVASGARIASRITSRHRFGSRDIDFMAFPVVCSRDMNPEDQAREDNHVEHGIARVRRSAACSRMRPVSRRAFSSTAVSPTIETNGARGATPRL
jgi:hypothetical protein